MVDIEKMCRDILNDKGLEMVITIGEWHMIHKNEDDTTYSMAVSFIAQYGEIPDDISDGVLKQAMRETK